MSAGRRRSRPMVQFLGVKRRWCSCRQNQKWPVLSRAHTAIRAMRIAWFTKPGGFTSAKRGPGFTRSTTVQTAETPKNTPRTQNNVLNPHRGAESEVRAWPARILSRLKKCNLQVCAHQLIRQRIPRGGKTIDGRRRRRPMTHWRGV